MLADYHTHSYRCGHARGTMLEYVEQAIDRLDEIALTDHFFLYFQAREERSVRWAMAEDEFPSHYDDMTALRDGYARLINIRVGVEVDFVPGAENDLAGALAPYRFDVILGGVHFLDEWMLDDADQSNRYRCESVTEIYRQYYRTLLQAVDSGLFDVVAHFDLPKKFGYVPQEDVSREIEDVLDAMADRRVALEVSTAGLRKPIGEIYPSEPLLRSAQQRRIPIVLSSDAHDPSEVGYRFDFALQTLARCGVREIASFENRELRLVPLFDEVRV